MGLLQLLFQQNRFFVLDTPKLPRMEKSIHLVAMGNLDCATLCLNMLTYHGLVQMCFWWCCFLGKYVRGRQKVTETSSNLGKSLLPSPSPSPPLFRDFLDPLLAFSIAILCFLIYHVMYFWSVDRFGSHMSHIHRQSFTPIIKRPSNSTWKQSILILCGIAVSLLFHMHG